MRFATLTARASAPLLGGVLALCACLSLAAPARAETNFSDLQKKDIGKIVHDYLLANPEVVKEAIEELEKREKLAEAEARTKTVTRNNDKLFNSANQAVVGNPNGDVTIVEFFDYNCGYCKQSLNNVAKLIESDPNVRVVLKDFAILGSDSQEVAQVAFAVREQFKGQKFWEFHRKLLSGRGHIGKAQALAAAKELGADMDRLEKDLKSPSIAAGMKEVEQLAEELKFNGTPSWVLGKEAIVGGVPYADLKARVDSLHKCGKTTC
jgi:protein-disulfide isomerase